MPSLKLTNRAVATLSAGAKDESWWDTELRGFGVKGTPRGTKVFIIQYRMGGRGSNVRRFTIGKTGAWDATKARVEAERLLRLASSGADPRKVDQQRQ